MWRREAKPVRYIGTIAVEITNFPIGRNSEAARRALRKNTALIFSKTLTITSPA